MPSRVEHRVGRPSTTPDERIDLLRGVIPTYGDGRSLVQVGFPRPEAPAKNGRCRGGRNPSRR